MVRGGFPDPLDVLLPLGKQGLGTALGEQHRGVQSCIVPAAKSSSGGGEVSGVAEVVLLYPAWWKVLCHWGAVRVEQLQLERLRTPLLECPLADGAPTLREKMPTQVCPVTGGSDPANLPSTE